jgi:hypothetical protein
MKVAPIVNKKSNWFTRIMDSEDVSFQRANFTTQKDPELTKIAIYNPNKDIFGESSNDIRETAVEDNLGVIDFVSYKLLKRKFKGQRVINPLTNVHFANEGLQISDMSYSLEELTTDINNGDAKIVVASNKEISDNYKLFSDLKNKGIKIISVLDIDEKKSDINNALIDSYVSKHIFGCGPSDIKNAYDALNAPDKSVKEDLHSKLQEIYPNVDEKFLCETADKIGDKIADLGERIDVTGSEIVIPIITADGTDYLKASTNSGAIVKEVRWDNYAKENSLTRIANASLKGIVNSNNYPGVISKGTQNEFTAEEYKDFKVYISTKENILRSYAQQHNVDISKLLMNPVIASVFNTAINHTFIGSHVDDKVLAKASTKGKKSFEELELRAKNTSDKYLLQEFRGSKDKYDLALDISVDQENVGSKIIIHGDNRPGNMGAEQLNKVGYFLGRKIDFGAARLGYVSEDLAKLETIDNASYIPLYKHCLIELNKVANKVFVDLDVKALQDKVSVDSLIHEVSAQSFALSKDNFQNVKRYSNIIEKKSHEKSIYRVA